MAPLAIMPPGRKKLTKFQLVRLRRQAREAASHNANNVGFLKLPAEIRNQIYELVVQSRRLQYLCVSEHYRDSQIVLPGLLRTSSQIRNEATSVFFSSNSFLVRCSSKADNFDHFMKAEIPAAVGRMPRAFLRNMTNLHIVIDLKVDHCKYFGEPNDQPEHIAEFQFIMVGNKYTVHAEFNGCGYQKCVDGMGDVMAEYDEAMEDMIKDKMQPSKKDAQRGIQCRALVQVERSQLPWPRSMIIGGWVMTWGDKDDDKDEFGHED